MTVHTKMEPDEVRDLLTLYDLGELQELSPARGRSTHTNYLLVTDRDRYLLRVHEGRRFRDLIYEKDLLLHLAELNMTLQAPEILPNVIKGFFTPISDEVYSSIFSFLPGRAIAPWEISPAHCAEIGAGLAELHQRGRGFRGHRRNPDRPARVFAQLDSARATTGEEHDFIGEARKLGRRLLKPLAGRLPHSLIHGRVQPSKVRFHRGCWVGLLDFEDATRGPALYDLGVSLNAWAWTQDQRFDPERAVALIEAYQRHQRLRPREQQLLLTWTRFAALRFAVRWLLRYELDAAAHEEQALYRDYRVHAEQLRALMAMSARSFAQSCGL